MYGGHRLGNNLFSDSLVCVKCATGERVWHYQIVHHDLWDYDLPAAPILADITVDGRRMKSVVQVTKQAFAFVFDRTNGHLCGRLKSDRAAVRDARRARVGHAAISDQAAAVRSARRDSRRSDRLHTGIACGGLQLVKQYRIGPVFTPPSIRGDGPGATRGRSSCPVRSAEQIGKARPSMLIAGCCTCLDHRPVCRRTLSKAIRSERISTTSPACARIRRARRTPAAQAAVRPHHAIDLNKGDIVWTTANGDGPRNHPLLKPLNLPALGNPGRGGLF